MRPRLSIAILSLLVAVAAQAAPPRMPSSAASTAATVTSPQASPADQKRAAAIQQYQHDLVSVVALRADPAYLLGAAILAWPFQHQTAGLDFNALSLRAAAAPGASPAVAWARLGLCKDKRDCPNAEAFATLKKQAADNAAVWLVAMDVAALQKDAKAEQAAFTQAVAATSYDDYFGKTLAAVAKAVTALAPLADTMQGAHGGQPDNPEGVRALIAVMATRGHPRPDLGPALQMCDPKAADMDAKRKTDCLQLAHTLQWGSSPIARAAGLHIEGELDPDAAAGAEQSAHNLAWQVHGYSGLLQHAMVDPSLAADWLARARNGGTELSLMLATLRANHVPTEAPADFQPASAGQTRH